VTQEMLGSYYDVEGLNAPYYFEDIDNDGIKDILVIDHGKEADPDWKNWKAFNVFFKGTANGFKKTEIIGLTDIKAYYHGHDVADFDNDGDLDIAVSGSVGIKIFKNDGNGVFSVMQMGQAKGNFAPFSLKFINTDNDPELELLGPPYRDFFVNGKPQGIEAVHIMQSKEAWDRFMRFMERYSQDNGLTFTKSNIFDS
jgi:photosystem II reaction center protein Psb28